MSKTEKDELLYNMENRDVEIPQPRLKRGGVSRPFLFGFATALCLVYLMDLGFEAYKFATLRETVQVASGELQTSWPPPPPHTEVARVARYVVHISDWASLATISTAAPIKGFPFANTASVSDGPVGLSSGTPYFYISNLDFTGRDLLTDARTTVSLSEAQSDYCHTSGFDPEDPRCARILLSGSIVEVKNGTEEATFARTALFSRHPVMETWPTGHHFFFAKLNISHIYVLDFFGGASDVSVQDYYKATPFP
ncbi:hypothetical protein Pcinc_011625 [Petrolisthes cinctipes]|uniref:CREG-like beta-barrel domain-containing protein n=1 Tax=Petrolisthes cinctipes TaxID=88211 RepID=A0AAE1G2F7_PETCI|nr:hypothetical protein Pcinc_011625 [Petrolisthes cinctipes]